MDVENPLNFNTCVCESINILHLYLPIFMMVTAGLAFYIHLTRKHSEEVQKLKKEKEEITVNQKATHEELKTIKEKAAKDKEDLEEAEKKILEMEVLIMNREDQRIIKDVGSRLESITLRNPFPVCHKCPGATKPGLHQNSSILMCSSCRGQTSLKIFVDYVRTVDIPDFKQNFEILCDSFLSGIKKTFERKVRDAERRELFSDIKGEDFCNDLLKGKDTLYDFITMI